MTKKTAENIIEIQNALEVKNGETLTKALIDYIGRNYDYEKPSDLFLSDTAAYDIDELTALFRCIRANGLYLTDGARADVCGRMAGNYLASYWKSHSKADRNGDGIMQLVILKGETGHQDSELRTEYFLQALAENGVRIERLGEESANWQRGEAREIMTEFLLSSDGIEAVFSNNDMMALGAIDALKEAGWFDDGPYMPVIGCDGIEEAIQAMEDGYLLYTVKNDAENQARAAYRIASLLAEDEVPDEDSIGYEMDGRYVWIPYQEIVL